MDKLIIGCGYLGLRVAQRWLAAGHHVTALTRQEARARELAALGVWPIVGDVMDPKSLTTVSSFGSILYAVGFDRASGRTMREIYVQGLRNVLGVAKLLARLQERNSGQPCSFTYISSTSVYGQNDGSWVDETSPTVPAGESGQIILEAEQLVRDAARKVPSLRANILRFAGIYGPDRLLRAESLRNGTPLAIDPETWLNLIHVDDGAQVVETIDQAALPGGIVNVCDGAPVRRGAFYRQLAGLLGAPEPTFIAPSGASGGHDAGNRRVSNAKLLREYGVELKYPSYEVGLKAAVAGSA